MKVVQSVGVILLEALSPQSLEVSSWCFLHMTKSMCIAVQLSRFFPL